MLAWYCDASNLLVRYRRAMSAYVAAFCGGPTRQASTSSCMAVLPQTQSSLEITVRNLLWRTRTTFFSCPWAISFFLSFPIVEAIHWGAYPCLLASSLPQLNRSNQDPNAIIACTTAPVYTFMPLLFSRRLLRKPELSTRKLDERDAPIHTLVRFLTQQLLPLAIPATAAGTC
jgi:hypothetical protein